MTTSNSILRAAAPAAVSVPSTRRCRAAFRNLSTVLCAAVLALGLAGCGGGGDGQRSDSSAAKREAVRDAIQAARNAVEALTGTSTAAQVRVTKNAIEAAKTAVTSASALSDSV